MSPLRAACRLVLALYPEGWRARYGPEIDEALEHRGVTPFTLLDLAASALYAHRHPELAPTEVLSMSARQRSSVISVLAATIVFAVGWAAVLSVRDPLPPWLAAADRHPDLRLAVGAVQAAGALAILAVLAGGLVLLGSASLRGGEAAGRSARGLGLAGVAFAGFIALLAAAGLGLVTPLNAAIGTGPASLVWGVALLACVAVGVIGSARAVRQAAPDPTALRVALLIGQVGAAAMALGRSGGPLARARRVGRSVGHRCPTAACHRSDGGRRLDWCGTSPRRGLRVEAVTPSLTTGSSIMTMRGAPASPWLSFTGPYLPRPACR